MKPMKMFVVLVGGVLLSGCVATLTPEGDLYTDLITPSVVVESRPQTVFVSRPYRPAPRVWGPIASRPRPIVVQRHPGHRPNSPRVGHPGGHRPHNPPKAGKPGGHGPNYPRVGQFGRHRPNSPHVGQFGGHRPNDPSRPGQGGGANLQRPGHSGGSQSGGSRPGGTQQGGTQLKGLRK